MTFFRFPAGQSRSSKLALGTTLLPINPVPLNYFYEAKRPERESDHPLSYQCQG